MSRLKVILTFLAECLGGLFLVVFLTNIFIYGVTRSYLYKNVADVPEAQVVVIPGAAVFPNSKLSSIFKDRVDKAIELYQAKKIFKILVSGDNSTVAHNEVNPVRSYLLQKGIPDADIFLDHAGFDTYSTMYRARDIFKVSSIIISTQSFHLPRAVFIARSLGINVYGISADNGKVMLKNYTREIFADEKAVCDLLSNRKPKFLGDVIPITGDGRNYP